jgi:hypothetical protein
MKNYRKAITALVFALVLSAPAFAGEIHTGLTATPPPVTGEMHTGATDGEIHTGKDSSTPRDIATGIALDLLQSLLSLL